MSFHDLSWSKTEKKIARTAFDAAYKKEILSIRKKAGQILDSLEEDEDIWNLEKYLQEKRYEIGEKYDYRYSRLILVFARLISDGFLVKSDLDGLSEEKLSMISRIIE